MDVELRNRVRRAVIALKDLQTEDLYIPDRVILIILNQANIDDDFKNELIEEFNLHADES